MDHLTSRMRNLMAPGSIALGTIQEGQVGAQSPTTPMGPPPASGLPPFIPRVILPPLYPDIDLSKADRNTRHPTGAFAREVEHPRDMSKCPPELRGRAAEMRRRHNKKFSYGNTVMDPNAFWGGIPPSVSNPRPKPVAATFYPELGDHGAWVVWLSAAYRKMGPNSAQRNTEIALRVVTELKQDYVVVRSKMHDFSREAKGVGYSRTLQTLREGEPKRDNHLTLFLGRWNWWDEPQRTVIDLKTYNEGHVYANSSPIPAPPPVPKLPTGAPKRPTPAPNRYYGPALPNSARAQTWPISIMAKGSRQILTPEERKAGITMAQAPVYDLYGVAGSCGYELVRDNIHRRAPTEKRPPLPARHPFNEGAPQPNPADFVDVPLPPGFGSPSLRATASSPTKSPTKSPAKSPAKSPTKSPAKSPTKSGAGVVLPVIPGQRD